VSTSIPTISPTATSISQNSIPSATISQPTLTPRVGATKTSSPTATLIATEEVIYDAQRVTWDTNIPICCDELILSIEQRQIAGAIKNSEFRHSDELYGSEMSLQEGVYFHECEEGFGSCYSYATNIVAFGDLDGDKREDAAAIIQSWIGGSGIHFELVAMVQRDGTFVTIPGFYLGNHIDISDIRIGSNTITLTIDCRLAEYGVCIPATAGDFHFRVKDNVLEWLRE
jgi:hypothetical protein